MALPLERNFMAIALPAVIAAVAVFCIRHNRAAQAHSANGAVVPGVPAAAK
jgi:AAHS family benzoate transporter-like MFS transporter